MQFLKVAMNEQRKARGEAELTTPDFIRLVKEAAGTLDISMEMLKRPLNVGFSGGEKKRAEILQMKLLEPKLCVLDETDSGLDIDALKIVADGVNSLRSPDRATIVITHYQRLLDYIVPDTVHVLSKGKIIKTGDKSLAHRTRGQGLRRHHQRGGLRRGGRDRHDRSVETAADGGRDHAGRSVRRAVQLSAGKCRHGDAARPCRSGDQGNRPADAQGRGVALHGFAASSEGRAVA
jgi:ABC-type multidrug transport system ATPase subunit